MRGAQSSSWKLMQHLYTLEYKEDSPGTLPISRAYRTASTLGFELELDRMDAMWPVCRRFGNRNRPPQTEPNFRPPHEPLGTGHRSDSTWYPSRVSTDLAATKYVSCSV